MQDAGARPRPAVQCTNVVLPLNRLLAMWPTVLGRVALRLSLSKSTACRTPACMYVANNAMPWRAAISGCPGVSFPGDNHSALLSVCCLQTCRLVLRPAAAMHLAACRQPCKQAQATACISCHQMRRVPSTTIHLPYCDILKSANALPTTLPLLSARTPTGVSHNVAVHDALSCNAQKYHHQLCARQRLMPSTASAANRSADHGPFGHCLAHALPTSAERLISVQNNRITT
jgi:hypothetical protein